jgi:hypothetical protein
MSSYCYWMDGRQGFDVWWRIDDKWMTDDGHNLRCAGAVIGRVCGGYRGARWHRRPAIATLSTGSRRAICGSCSRSGCALYPESPIPTRPPSERIRPTKLGVVGSRGGGGGGSRLRWGERPPVCPSRWLGPSGVPPPSAAIPSNPIQSDDFLPKFCFIAM